MFKEGKIGNHDSFHNKKIGKNFARPRIQQDVLSASRSTIKCGGDGRKVPVFRPDATRRGIRGFQFKTQSRTESVRERERKRKTRKIPGTEQVRERYGNRETGNILRRYAGVSVHERPPPAAHAFLSLTLPLTYDLCLGFFLSPTLSISL